MLHLALVNIFIVYSKNVLVASNPSRVNVESATYNSVNISWDAQEGGSQYRYALESFVEVMHFFFID